ncbi:MAG: hypothetical protein JOZ96_18490 [Acidobacteria bacterium]|nr:hypothetical protein [Acidobacteriota bacterium]
MSQRRDVIYGNGVLAGSGRPSLEISADDLYAAIQAEFDGRSAEEKSRADSLAQAGLRTHLGPPPRFEADDLTQVRWGVIWPPEPLTAEEEAHRAALAPLLAHRKAQMRGRKPLEFHYQKGWAYDEFLWETGQVETGEMRPESVPYYLCIVGPPSRIPWEFQQYLDGEYAVGRLWFDDPADCQSYVEHLIQHEEADEAPPLAREALLFGTRHENDPATQSSSSNLVQPLFDWLTEERAKYKFKPSLLLGDDAKGGAYKAKMLERLTGGARRKRPALLFTAGHGMEYEKVSGEQAATQGALISQEWPGLGTPPQPEHYLSGDDLPGDIELEGMVAVSFACFSAGTPLRDDWVYPSSWQRSQQIAEAPFVARLPQKMLARGLMAFVGHVSRAWEFSFLNAGGDPQIETFRAILGELLSGERAGHATDYLNDRWQRQTVQLEKWLSDKKRQREQDAVIALWQARNDGRGYVVLGDPAAKMRVDLLH